MQSWRYTIQFFWGGLNFLLSQMRQVSTHNCYFFFGGVCLLGTLFIALAVPETKGRSEEDMKGTFNFHEKQKNASPYLPFLRENKLLWI